MADQKSISFDALMTELRSGQYRQVYYLQGDESYYIDLVADYIAEHALQPEERDFNLTVVYGNDVNASQIADTARRYPMMAERQVVIVKDAQNLKNTDALVAYLKQPMPQTVLVMCHRGGTLDGRKRELIKLIQQAGILFESKKLFEGQLPRFIEDYLSKRNVSIDPKSTQMIADHIGSDLSRLVGELDKLILALPKDNLRVTPQVVEQQVGVSKEYNTFELRDAIVNKNILKANQIVNYFDKNPKAGSLYSFLPMLFNYFQNLMIAYYCNQRTSQEAVASWLGMKSPWAAKDYMTGMRNFTARKTLAILSKLRETDAKSKGLDNVNTPAGELMRELIFFILH